jgi:hypothetical protein
VRRDLFAFEVAIEDLELRALELISVVLGVGGSVRTERTGGVDTVRFVSCSSPQRQRASLILRESPHHLIHFYLRRTAATTKPVYYIIRGENKRTCSKKEQFRSKI